LFSLRNKATFEKTLYLVVYNKCTYCLTKVAVLITFNGRMLFVQEIDVISNKFILHTRWEGGRTRGGARIKESERERKNNPKSFFALLFHYKGFFFISPILYVI
jgi:hypothetical protein